VLFPLPMKQIIRSGHLAATLALGLAVLAACATAPITTTTASTPVVPPVAPPSQPPVTQQDFQLAPASYLDLPGWTSADLIPALSAYQRWCQTLSRRSADAPLSTSARYGGVVRDWLPACTAAAAVSPDQARAFFESNFQPVRVLAGQGEARLTAYFEPVIDARRSAGPGFTEPFLRPPADMVTVDIAGFAAAYDNEALRGAPRELRGILQDGRVRPYPQRASLPIAPGQAFAYAHPADVYKLQVQGSGRLRFPDGVEVRAAFAAQNGYRWRSALGAARERGDLSSPTWANFRTFLDGQSPEGVRAALGADPSYVFFQEEAITDPTIGPRGAAGVPLTALGSMAVDPAFHPYGALLFVAASHDGGPFNRLMMAQDTGGAIRRGPLRGDVFWGTGAAAGAAAERMNSANPSFWTLLPRGMAVS
jgi:membrane-bound lytic murein transglycosylase A